MFYPPTIDPGLRGGRKATRKFENGKLYVVDRGSILENKPDLNGDWIAYDTVKGEDGVVRNTVKHTHGYGENFFPDEKDPRKVWLDEYGYPIRVFDQDKKHCLSNGSEESLQEGCTWNTSSQWKTSR